MLQIITSLRSGRRYDANMLAEELEVSRRTVFRDLNLLSMAGVPYYFDEQARTYNIRRSFFLPSINFTVDEALALLLATRKLMGQRQIPLFQHSTKAAIKIESALPPALQEYCGSLLDNVEVRWPPMADDQNVDENFDSIRLGIVQHRKLGITYRSLLEQNTIRTVISPYRLMFIHRAWYVIGLSAMHKQVRTFKISRIENIDLRQETFSQDGYFSLEDYLGNAWVMMPEGKEYTVELQFTAKVGSNVAEVLWHRTQRTELLGDGSLKFEVDVDGLREIAWWILGYGDQVEVIRPQQLKDSIRQTAENMLRLYENSEPATGQTPSR